MAKTTDSKTFTSKALDPASPSPSPSPSAVSSIATLPTNVDAFLLHLHRCLATPSGIDTVLQLICYAAKLTAALADTFAEATLHKAAMRFASLVLTIPYTAHKLPTPKNAARALRISAAMKALSALLSEGRMFMRLWALVGMYAWAKGLIGKAFFKQTDKETSKEMKTEEGMDKAIAWVQLLSCVSLQFLENRAYLAQKKVINLPESKINWALSWSTRLWGLYVGTEIGRLLLEKQRKRHGVDAASEEHKTWREKWNSLFLRNLAWAPLTVSFSLEKGFAGDAGVGLLACIPGIIQMRELWKDTA